MLIIVAINSLKNFVLEDRGYIQKNMVLNFSLFKTVFFLHFLFSVYKMVDSISLSILVLKKK